ncbi:hypothetical protein AUK22_01015 [bacterium CG2_30_54_10]|nr:MAG: hypothetical protein AUK22_01015 [bacterium CG2_30_54_10]
MHFSNTLYLTVFPVILAAFLSLSGAGILVAEESVAGPVSAGEKVVSRLLERLERVDGVRGFGDEAFSDRLVTELREVLDSLKNEPSSEFESVQEFEVLYAAARYFKRNELAKKLLLDERRRRNEPEIQNWIFTELIEINRQQILSRAGYPLPESAMQKSNGADVPDVTARYSLGHGGSLFSPAVTDAKTAEMVQVAQAYEEEASRLLQMGNKNAAIRMIDLAAQKYSSIHGKTDFAFGPLVWAARYVRDLGLPLAAIIRFEVILNKLGQVNSSWLGIVLEDLGGLYQQLGHNEKAIQHYKKASAAYEAGNNPEGRERTEGKSAALAK